jgi:cell division protein FtsQ
VLPANKRVERPSDPGPPPDAGNSRSKKSKGNKRLAAGRWLSRLSLLTGILVVVSASLLCAWGLRRYLRASSRFSVRTVHVDGNVRRTPHQLSQRAGIAPGMNIFEVDEAAARAALEADPWIQSATVTTDLPSGVFVKVVEREASALATLDSSLYLVDTAGEIFKQVEEGDPIDLPVVTGIDPDLVARDREAVTIRIRRALDLVADLERAGVAKRYPVQELHIEPDTAITVTLGTEGLALAFGTPPYRSKIAKADRILGELRHREVKPAVIFLDNDAHPERVVVRMK